MASTYCPWESFSFSFFLFFFCSEKVDGISGECERRLMVVGFGWGEFLRLGATPQRVDRSLNFWSVAISTTGSCALSLSLSVFFEFIEFQWFWWLMIVGGLFFLLGIGCIFFGILFFLPTKYFNNQKREAQTATEATSFWIIDWFLFIFFFGNARYELGKIWKIILFKLSLFWIICDIHFSLTNTISASEIVFLKYDFSSG